VLLCLSDPLPVAAWCDFTINSKCEQITIDRHLMSEDRVAEFDSLLYQNMNGVRLLCLCRPGPIGILDLSNISYSGKLLLDSPEALQTGHPRYRRHINHLPSKDQIIHNL
jgi:hypothetical protein